MDQQIAVMKNVKFGAGDRGRCWLTFDAYTAPGRAAFLILEVPEAVALIEAYGVADVARLSGKTVYVSDSDGFIRYVGPCVI
jgi:hypothetical protein